MKLPAASVPRRTSTVVTPVEASVSPVASAGLSGENHVDDFHTRIALIAYGLYEQRGRQDGHHVEDWLTAEQMILRGASTVCR